MKVSKIYDNATAVPVDKNAADVFRKGEHAPEVALRQPNWKAPPKTMPNPPGKVDLTGRKFGHMTVIGLFGFNKRGERRWLVRCVCGDYELRKSSTIKNSKDPRHRCGTCNYWEQARSGRPYQSAEKTNEE